jgi:hypothetical protein
MKKEKFIKRKIDESGCFYIQGSYFFVGEEYRDKTVTILGNGTVLNPEGKEIEFDLVEQIQITLVHQPQKEPKQRKGTWSSSKGRKLLNWIETAITDRTNISRAKKAFDRSRDAAKVGIAK